MSSNKSASNKSATPNKSAASNKTKQKKDAKKDVAAVKKGKGANKRSAPAAAAAQTEPKKKTPVVSNEEQNTNNDEEGDNGTPVGQQTPAKDQKKAKKNLQKKIIQKKNNDEEGENDEEGGDETNNNTTNDDDEEGDQTTTNTTNDGDEEEGGTQNKNKRSGDNNENNKRAKKQRTGNENIEEEKTQVDPENIEEEGVKEIDEVPRPEASEETKVALKNLYDNHISPATAPAPGTADVENEKKSLKRELLLPLRFGGFIKDPYKGTIISEEEFKRSAKDGEKKDASALTNLHYHLGRIINHLNDNTPDNKSMEDNALFLLRFFLLLFSLFSATEFNPLDHPVDYDALRNDVFALIFKYGWTPIDIMKAAILLIDQWYGSNYFYRVFYPVEVSLPVYHYFKYQTLESIVDLRSKIAIPNTRAWSQAQIDYHKLMKKSLSGCRSTQQDFHGAGITDPHDQCPTCGFIKMCHPLARPRAA